MSDITIPQSMWDKFIAPLFDRKPETVEVVKTVEPEDYAAIKQENEQYKAQLEAEKLAGERKARVEKFTAELTETKADPTLAELLADVPAETAEAVMKQFKALSEQINESALTGEQGTEGAGNAEDPKAAFNAAVLALAASKSIQYTAAFEEVKHTQPDLFKAAFAK